MRNEDAGGRVDTFKRTGRKIVVCKKLDPFFLHLPVLVLET